METSIRRLLEIGVAFILFMIGISTFIVMHQGIRSMIGEGKEATVRESQVRMIEGAAKETLTTIEELYFLLTDEHIGDRSNWLGDTGYVSMAGRVTIYIDGVEFTGVTDYKGRQNLRGSLLSLTHSQFEKDYHINAEGLITEIHFTGR